MKIFIKKSSLVPCSLIDVDPGEIFWCDYLHDTNSNPLLFMKIKPRYDDNEELCAIGLDDFMVKKFDIYNTLVYTAKSDLLIDMSQNA